MENEVWEKIAQFLNQLRGEQLSRASSVRMPELTEKQKQAEKLMEECRAVLKSIPEADRQLFLKYQEQAEEVSYLQEQKSYLQGCYHAAFGGTNDDESCHFFIFSSHKS